MRKLILILISAVLITACSPALPENGESTVEINGVNLWYKVAGQGNTVLLVQAPSQGTASHFLVQSMKPLEAEYKVVYYDTRGSGNSERNPDPDTLNIGQIVEDLEALRQHLELEEFAMYGQSNGALIALNYAAKYPDHLTHLIVTSAGFGDPPEYSQTKIGELAANEEYLEAVMGLGNLSTLTSDQDFTEWFKLVGIVYCWDTTACKNYAAQVPDDLMDLETFLAISATSSEYETIYEQLASIEVPTLVVAGEHDVFNSVDAARKVVEGLPKGELLVLEDCNHMPTFDNPQGLFSAMTEFTSR